MHWVKQRIFEFNESQVPTRQHALLRSDGAMCTICYPYRGAEFFAANTSRVLDGMLSEEGNHQSVSVEEFDAAFEREMLSAHGKEIVEEVLDANTAQRI